MFDPMLDRLAVDDWPLSAAARFGIVALECRACRKFARLDASALAAKLGPDVTLGAVAARARCRRCACRGAYALVHLNGVRGDRAWRPAPPKMRRD